MYIYPSQLTQLASSSWVGGLGFCDGAESSIAIRSFILSRLSKALAGMLGAWGA